MSRPDDTILRIVPEPDPDPPAPRPRNRHEVRLLVPCFVAISHTASSSASWESRTGSCLAREQTMTQKWDLWLGLWAGAEGGDESTVRNFLAQGAPVNETRRGGYTVLMSAAANGHARVVRILLDAGANPSAKTRHGESVLWFALQDENLQVVQILLHSPLLNADDDIRYGDTAFLVAVRRRDTNAARLFLERGIDANSSSRDGTTPLILAAQAGDTCMIELLLRYKADASRTDISDRTPLIWAAMHGHVDAAASLLRLGESCIDHTDVNQHTALTYAAHAGRICMFTLLAFDYCANLSVADLHTLLDVEPLSGEMILPLFCHRMGPQLRRALLLSLMTTTVSSNQKVRSLAETFLKNFARWRNVCIAAHRGIDANETPNAYLLACEYLQHVATELACPIPM
ncbi:Ankyrin-1 [Porphyridium purpureum]|uniref:Ankyrin-1 n=1 Tax=Porphyridium purpureum TaxID=35688 RepID=A0A5J4Z1X2_PORPP|nr:Ankyrin-1 [Porphyridium purpureum]|eukprot:POR6388..scf208_2